MVQTPSNQKVERLSTNKNARRCQALLKKREGKQCGRPALRNADYCQFHGAYQQLRAKREPVRIDPLGKNLYSSKYLGETLYELFKDLREQEPEELLQLQDEITLMRATLGQTLTRLKEVNSGESSDAEKRKAQTAVQADIKKLADLVSRGISGRTPLRLHCPPELAIMILVRESSD